LLPAAPGNGPSTAQRPWDSPFKALLLPASGTPLGASPLLSFPRVARKRAARPRLQRLTLVGKGPLGPRASAATSKPCLPGVSPLQGFLLRHLGSASRSTPLLPFRPETLPTVYSRTGLQGFERDASGWSLSRLPALLGFCTFPVHARLEPPSIPGVWFCLGAMDTSARASLGWTSAGRSSARDRLGALGLTQHPASIM
jgi:hypothetical protein